MKLAIVSIAATNIFFKTPTDQIDTPQVLIQDKVTIVSASEISDSILNNNIGINSQSLFNRINSIRQTQGQEPFIQDLELCRLANQRSTEIVSEIKSGKLHSGLSKLETNHQIVENAVKNRTESGALSWWLNSPLHFESITGSYEYSCTACTHNYCVQLFSNLN